MMLKKHLFSAFLLISLAGLPGIAGDGDHVPRQTSFFRDQVVHGAVLLAMHDQEPQTVHEEKRHRKTLLPQAIVANFSLPRREFTYQRRQYSFFLQDGRTQRTPGHSSLRGPPSCS
jgi:hypothetical protein